MSGLAVVVVLAVGSAAPAAKTPTWTAVRADGLTKVTLAQPAVEVTIVSAGKPPACLARTLPQVPGLVLPAGRSGVTEIGITIAAKPLFVPLSLVSCLYDPNRARLERLPNGVVRLYLDGGDGATGYLLTVDFDKDRVQRRAIEPAELPGEKSEETVYNRIVVE